MKFFAILVGIIICIFAAFSTIQGGDIVGCLTAFSDTVNNACLTNKEEAAGCIEEAETTLSKCTNSQS